MDGPLSTYAGGLGCSNGLWRLLQEDHNGDKADGRLKAALVRRAGGRYCVSRKSCCSGASNFRSVIAAPRTFRGLLAPGYCDSSLLILNRHTKFPILAGSLVLSTGKMRYGCEIASGLVDQLTLDLLERLAFGLGQTEENEDESGCADGRIHPKSVADAEKVFHQWEGVGEEEAA